MPACQIAEPETVTSPWESGAIDGAMRDKQRA